MSDYAFVALLADTLHYHKNRGNEVTKLSMSLAFYIKVANEIAIHSVPDWSEGLGMRAKMLLGVPIDIIEADMDNMWYTVEIT